MGALSFGGRLAVVAMILIGVSASANQARAYDPAAYDLCVETHPTYPGTTKMITPVSTSFLTADGITISFSNYGDAETLCWITARVADGSLYADSFIAYFYAMARIEGSLITAVVGSPID